MDRSDFNGSYRYLELLFAVYVENDKNIFLFVLTIDNTAEKIIFENIVKDVLYRGPSVCLLYDSDVCIRWRSEKNPHSCVCQYVPKYVFF